MKHYIYILVVSMLLASCMKTVDNQQAVDTTPDIFPDYIGVTIPVDIAPMNFSMSDNDYECIDVVVKGNKGGEMHVQGEFADFDIDEWHELTRNNEGGKLTFMVCALKNGQWLQYKDFDMMVSPYHLDDYGLTYRLIAPGYEVGGDIGIYQRDLHSFDETKILHESAVPGQCMNCHTANKGNADEFLIHVRGSKGGTVIQQNGQQTWLNTKTDSTKANMGYSYWHPSGRYIASSINSIHQSFFVGKDRRIEVFDTMSDVLVYDIKSNQLLLNPLLQTSDWETYPVFSADGKTLFYCTSKPFNVPAEYDKPRYSLCKIAFNPDNGTYGDKVDTLLNAYETLEDGRDSVSFTYPRPSYDGKWLMFGVTDFGNFPVNHKEADLWIMNLKTGEKRSLAEVNSDDVESFHNWSTNSHWFVFSTRRGDGMYTTVMLSSLDDNGKATKPFLLPQRNPKKFYHDSLWSYNCPDFTKEKVDFDARKAGNECLEGERKQVVIR